MRKLFHAIAWRLASRKPRPGEYADPQPERVLR
jgi:hypothetical protein